MIIELHEYRYISILCAVAPQLQLRTLLPPLYHRESALCRVVGELDNRLGSSDFFLLSFEKQFYRNYNKTSNRSSFLL